LKQLDLKATHSVFQSDLFLSWSIFNLVVFPRSYQRFNEGLGLVRSFSRFLNSRYFLSIPYAFTASTSFFASSNDMSVCSLTYFTTFTSPIEFIYSFIEARNWSL